MGGKVRAGEGVIVKAARQQQEQWEKGIDEKPEGVPGFRCKPTSTFAGHC
jgi:hypothetical protein